VSLTVPSVSPSDGTGVSTAAPPLASVVVVSRGPSLVLARLLRSLARVQEANRLELLLGVDASSLEEAVRLVERLAPEVHARVIGLDGGSPGERRNGVTHAARGEVVLFLDDDVEVREDLVSSLDAAFADPGVIVVGGPNLTPPTAPRFEQVAGRVLASPLGSGPVRHRYTASAEKPGRNRSLTLCNLAIRRRVVELEPFAPELLCAEENELLGRMAGGRIVHTPALAVYHHRRSGFYLHARQLFKYGIGRGQVVARHPSSLRQLAFLAPAAAALAALALLVVAPVAGLLVVGAYAVAVGVEAVRIGGVRDAPLAASLLVLTHVAYAAGTVSGIAYELVQRR
jgi:hypothetical protein